MVKYGQMALSAIRLESNSEMAAIQVILEVALSLLEVFLFRL